MDDHATHSLVICGVSDIFGTEAGNPTLAGGEDYAIDAAAS
jgi:hypothetical protein